MACDHTWRSNSGLAFSHIPWPVVERLKSQKDLANFKKLLLITKANEFSTHCGQKW